MTSMISTSSSKHVTTTPAEPFQWKFAKRIQETSAQVDEMHDEFSDLIEKIEQGLNP